MNTTRHLYLSFALLAAALPRVQAQGIANPTAPLPPPVVPGGAVPPQAAIVEDSGTAPGGSPPPRARVVEAPRGGAPGGAFVPAPPPSAAAGGLPQPPQPPQPGRPGRVDASRHSVEARGQQGPEAGRVNILEIHGPEGPGTSRLNMQYRVAPGGMTGAEGFTPAPPVAQPGIFPAPRAEARGEQIIRDIKLKVFQRHFETALSESVEMERALLDAPPERREAMKARLDGLREFAAKLEGNIHALSGPALAQNREERHESNVIMSRVFPADPSGQPQLRNFQGPGRVPPVPADQSRPRRRVSTTLPRVSTGPEAPPAPGPAPEVLKPEPPVLPPVQLATPEELTPPPAVPALPAPALEPKPVPPAPVPTPALAPAQR